MLSVPKRNQWLVANIYISYCSNQISKHMKSAKYKMYLRSWLYKYECYRLLHQAALWDNAELLEDLLTSNSDELACLNARDSWGRTALHAAATNDDSRCLRILVQVENMKTSSLLLCLYLI